MVQRSANLARAFQDFHAKIAAFKRFDGGLEDVFLVGVLTYTTRPAPAL